MTLTPIDYPAADPNPDPIQSMMRKPGPKTTVRAGAFFIAGVLAFAVSAAGQQEASPIASSGSLQEKPALPTISVGTTEVLVPTLVQMPKGEVVYGLGPADFQLLDNGVRQTLHVDDDLDSEPVSVVVAVEKGRMASLEFAKINRLAPLIDLFLGDGVSEAAFVTFDSKPHLVVPFTRDADSLGRELRRIEDGDGGAAILDTIGYSVKLLEERPKDHRRVLLLISETRDHGSREVDARHVVEQIGISNTLVLSVSFSPSKALFLHDLKRGYQETSMADLLTPLMMAIQAVRTNVAKQIATMSGGEYAPFTTERGFEARVQEVAGHARNRYLLSFHPSDNTPGLHVLDVQLTRNLGARVVARANYWAGALDAPAASP
jgi:VWFA-related protein